MKTPFKFLPSYFTTLFYADEATVSGVGDSPAPASTDAPASPAVGEAFGASPETGEQATGDVTATNEVETAAAEPDFLEGIPSLEQLQAEAERKVPYAEGLLKLRAEYERINPDYKQLSAWKPLAEQFNDPAKVQERLTGYESIFSPKVVNGQPVLDERNLPVTTAHPFLDQGEAKRQGYAMDHFLDVLDYEVTNPLTQQKEPLITQFFHNVLGLDINKLEQYQKIDELIAKTNGNITPEELGRVAEPDREIYKTLPSGLRKDWEYMDEETRRFHLDGAKERLENRQFRENTQAAAKAKEQDDRQAFETQVQQDFVQDLTQVREQAFSSLRDNLARQWQPSTDDAINQDRYDDVLAPLIQLIDPDLQPMALKRLEREGIKIDTQSFNQNMSALVGARQTYVRAQAYGDGLATDRALQDFTRLHTQLMAKFNTIALQRAEKYGMQAKKIADSKGELLATASQVRPTVPGSTAPQTFSATGLPEGMDPRSSEAAMLQWKQSRPQTA